MIFNNGIMFKNNEVSELLTNKIAVNEVYFGKTKELLAAEQQLDKFRSKYLGRYVLNTKVNSDPDLLEFDRMMEDIFGFGCFTLHVHNQAECNAFTMPIDYRIDYGNPYDNIIADKRGFKFDRKYDYACITGIYSGLIFNPEFTTPEIMAILLHEVGHNFNSSINKANGCLTSLFVALAIYIDILLNFSPGNLINAIKDTNFYRKYVDRLGKSLRERDALPVNIYDMYVQVIDIIKHGGNIISDAIRVLSMGTYTLALGVISGVISILTFVSNPINLLLNIFLLKLGYTSEESADNFVAIYGYGSELANGLRKMGGKEGASASVIMKAFDQIPIISTLMHLNEVPAFLLLAITDEHTNNVSRIKDQIELLERELNKEDIDPKMVKYIKSDIKLCEEALDMLIDCSTGITDPYIGRKFYNKMAYYGNNTKRKLFGNKQKFEEYDRVFKNASK